MRFFSLYFLLLLCLFVGAVSAASSYKDLVNDLHNGVEVVNFSGVEDLSFSGTIVIDRHVVLNGNGATIENNGICIPCFKIVNGGSLTLNNFTFSTSKDYAIEVDNGGYLYVNNSDFRYLNSGAVDLHNGGSAIVNNSFVQNGYAVSQFNVLTGSTLLVENSQFNYNNDSCLHIWGNNIHINITNSTFKGNVAPNGGVLYFLAAGDGSEICLNHNEFSNNKANSSGGVLFNNGFGSYNVSLADNLFEGNAAATDQGACIFTSGKKCFSYYLTGNDFRNSGDSDKIPNAMFLTINDVPNDTLFYCSNNTIDGNMFLKSYINKVDCNPNICIL